MRRRPLGTLLGLSLAVGFAAAVVQPLVVGTKWMSAAHALGVGQKAPDFALPDASGKTVRLSSLTGAGKVVLVDFWASWCEPCKRELPLLGQVAERLRSANIEIVAINIDKSRDKADAFLRSRKIAGVTVLFNPDLSIADKYQPPTMPSSFGIDKQGKVRFVHAGFQPGDEQKLERELLKLAK